MAQPPITCALPIRMDFKREMFAFLAAVFLTTAVEGPDNPGATPPILKDYKENEAKHPDSVDGTRTYDLKLLKEKEELALAAAIESVKQDTVAAINVENFKGAMNALAELRAPVDHFFDKVTVNDPDPMLRANRLRLLSEIRAATLTVADFSKIAG